jgi:thiosulfate dehydrogenase [quinone] large subunit
MGYLAGAQGFLKGIFQGIGTSPTLIGVVDFVTIWAMIFIGIALTFGFLVKPAGVIGMVLLAMFYLAYPPFPGMESSAPVEGSYIIVNKNLIELFALLVVVGFPTAHFYGIERFFVRSTSIPTTN